jgi:hypothetical protein
VWGEKEVGVVDSIDDLSDQLEHLRIRANIRQDAIDRIRALLDDFEALQDANFDAQEILMDRLDARWGEGRG